MAGPQRPGGFAPAAVPSLRIGGRLRRWNARLRLRGGRRLRLGRGGRRLCRDTRGGACKNKYYTDKIVCV